MYTNEEAADLCGQRTTQQLAASFGNMVELDNSVKGTAACHRWAPLSPRIPAGTAGARDNLGVFKVYKLELYPRSRRISGGLSSNWTKFPKAKRGGNRLELQA